MDHAAPLREARFLLAGSPSRKGVHAICDQVLKAELCVQVRE